MRGSSFRKKLSMGGQKSKNGYMGGILFASSSEYHSNPRHFVTVFPGSLCHHIKHELTATLTHTPVDNISKYTIK